MSNLEASVLTLGQCLSQVSFQDIGDCHNCKEINRAIICVIAWGETLSSCLWYFHWIQNILKPGWIKMFLFFLNHTNDNHRNNQSSPVNNTCKTLGGVQAAQRGLDDLMTAPRTSVSQHAEWCHRECGSHTVKLCFVILSYHLEAHFLSSPRAGILCLRLLWHVTLRQRQHASFFRNIIFIQIQIYANMPIKHINLSNLAG